MGPERKYRARVTLENSRLPGLEKLALSFSGGWGSNEDGSRRMYVRG